MRDGGGAALWPPQSNTCQGGKRARETAVAALTERLWSPAAHNYTGSETDCRLSSLSQTSRGGEIGWQRPTGLQEDPVGRN